MTMPNFLIIGAAKAGTTALYSYINQHPQVFMSPEKEPHFFAFEGEKVKFAGTAGEKEWLNRTAITDIKTYQQQFCDVSQETAIGEASALYLYIPKASERIYHYLPNVKLIAILRNPVERAYSAFVFQKRDGLEPHLEFAQALQEEAWRMKNNWVPIYYYQDMGFYYHQVKRYFDLFPQEQIKVYLHDDFIANPLQVLQDAFRFLGIDHTFTPNTSTKHNVSGIPKNKALHKFLRIEKHPIKTILKPLIPKNLRRNVMLKLHNNNLEKAPPLSPDIRKQLVELYREDILQLQDLLQKDLSRWLSE
ncbi:sulfotransferase family protein [Gloeocapsopsis dulcis]|uniref:Sulfotransferase n=1 Tax=Gloeocapsopsis dulcis AAB1 = 1H9 TaxID=1433147 RepID=A0A6N8G1E9_9CHRO|nr:sulfotransferase domain-containing protein [Gloeocapsopsis dulcis]MUL39031.1 sulfotransferase [Gloeocapsopsis dulcis AAB1 = 1H9]WNN90560.1 sulfotransferase [Gloeocapsopsis dulcis]